MSVVLPVYTGRLCKSEAPFFYRSLAALDRARRERVLQVADYIVDVRREFQQAYQTGGKNLQQCVLDRARQLEALYQGEENNPLAAVIRTQQIRRVYFLETVDGPNLEWARMRNRDRAQFAQLVFKTATAPMMLTLLAVGVEEKRALSLATPFAEAVVTLQRMQRFAKDFADGRVWFPETELNTEAIDGKQVAAGKLDGELRRYFEDRLARVDELLEKAQQVAASEEMRPVARTMASNHGYWSAAYNDTVLSIREGKLPTIWRPGFFQRFRLLH